MPEEISGKLWYTTPEVMEMFSWTRQNVSAISMREGWQTILGFRNVYLADDVDDYRISREHTAAAKFGGLWRSTGLLRHKSGYASSCPICSWDLGEQTLERWRAAQLENNFSENKEG